MTKPTEDLASGGELDSSLVSSGGLGPSTPGGGGPKLTEELSVKENALEGQVPDDQTTSTTTNDANSK